MPALLWPMLLLPLAGWFFLRAQPERGPMGERAAALPQGGGSPGREGLRREWLAGLCLGLLGVILVVQLAVLLGRAAQGGKQAAGPLEDRLATALLVGDLRLELALGLTPVTAGLGLLGVSVVLWALGARLRSHRDPGRASRDETLGRMALGCLALLVVLLASDLPWLWAGWIGVLAATATSAPAGSRASMLAASLRILSPAALLLASLLLFWSLGGTWEGAYRPQTATLQHGTALWNQAGLALESPSALSRAPRPMSGARPSPARTRWSPPASSTAKTTNPARTRATAPPAPPRRTRTPRVTVAPPAVHPSTRLDDLARQLGHRAAGRRALGRVRLAGVPAASLVPVLLLAAVASMLLSGAIAARSGPAGSAPAGLLLLLAGAGLLWQGRAVLALRSGAPAAAAALLGAGIAAWGLLSWRATRSRGLDPGPPVALARPPAALDAGLLPRLARRLVGLFEAVERVPSAGTAAAPRSRVGRLADTLGRAGAWLDRHAAWPGDRLGLLAARVSARRARGASRPPAALLLLMLLWPLPLGAAPDGGAAAPPAAAAQGRVTLSPSPIDLDPDGQPTLLTLHNGTDQPLLVARIALGPGSSPHLRITRPLRPGTRLLPGESSAMELAYSPPPNQRPRPAFGDLQVHGQLGPGSGALVLLAHGSVRARQGTLLTLLLLTPLALGAALLLVRRRQLVRALQLLGALLPIGLALELLGRYQPEVTQLAGNSGLQLVERRSWLRLLGSDYLLGIDGLSILPVLLILAAAALAVLCCTEAPGAPVSGAPTEPQASPGGPAGARATATRAALVLGLEAAALGSVLSLDLLLMSLFWLTTLPLLFHLQRQLGESPLGAWTVLGHRLLAGLLLLLALVLLYRSSPPVSLTDGTPVAHHFDLLQLIQATRRNVGPGQPGTLTRRLAWVLLVAGLLWELGAFPLHAWRARALAGTRPAAGPGPYLPRPETSRPLALVLVGVLWPWPAHGLLRVASAALPEALRWGAPILLALGLLGLLVAVLRSLARPAPGERLATAALAHSGVFLLGLAAAATATAAGAPQAQLGQTALNGAVLNSFSAGLALVLGALLRPQKPSAHPSGPLGTVVHLALLGTPGFGTFLSLTLLLFGVFPFHPLAATAALGLWGALVLVQLRPTAGSPTAGEVAAPPPAALAANGEEEEPWPARTALRVGAPLLALLLLGLGIYPLPALDLIKGAISDLLHVVALSAPLGR